MAAPAVSTSSISEPVYNRADTVQIGSNGDWARSLDRSGDDDHLGDAILILAISAVYFLLWFLTAPKKRQKI